MDTARSVPPERMAEIADALAARQKAQRRVDRLVAALADDFDIDWTAEQVTRGGAIVPLAPAGE